MSTLIQCFDGYIIFNVELNIFKFQLKMSTKILQKVEI